jgi:hypothetical protein
MTIVLMGRGPRADAARAILQRLFPGTEIEEAHPSPEALARHSAAPPALLVLVDPQPFAGIDAAESMAAVGLAELLRAEALRAVFALELARRAAAVCVLEGDAAAWPAALAGAAPLAGASERPDLPPVDPPPADRPLDLAIELPAPRQEAAAPAEVTPLLGTYLVPLWRAAAAGRPPPVVWPRESFLDGDVPGETLPALIEVAGRARIVAYGPYLPLPAGGWCARAWLGFSPDIGRLPFILEVDSGAGVTRGFFEVERGGIYFLDLAFRVADPLHALELRLITQDSALEGQAALIEVRLDPA